MHGCTALSGINRSRWMIGTRLTSLSFVFNCNNHLVMKEKMMVPTFSVVPKTCIWMYKLGEVPRPPKLTTTCVWKESRESAYPPLFQWFFVLSTLYVQVLFLKIDFAIVKHFDDWEKLINFHNWPYISTQSDTFPRASWCLCRGHKVKAIICGEASIAPSSCTLAPPQRGRVFGNEWAISLGTLIISFSVRALICNGAVHTYARTL